MVATEKKRYSTTLRLPRALSERLAQAAARQERSQAYIVLKALERYLDQIEREGVKE